MAKRRATHDGDRASLEQRNHELSILNAITAALNRSVQLDEALQAALKEVAELLNLQTGWVWLVSAETSGFYLAATQELPSGLTIHPELMEGSCYCLDTYAAGDLDGAANINVVSCSRLKKLVDENDGLRYHASIPLYAHEQRLGVLNVASRDWRQLSADDLRLLHTIGDLLSIAIERAQLFQRSADLGAAEERNRLARELHDTLAQGLTAVLLQLETADALLETRAEPLRIRKALHQAMASTRTSLEDTRRSVLDLRAAPLEGRNIAEALAQLVNDLEHRQHLQVGLTVTGAHTPLPARLEVGLYRIAQEGLRNVVRHAQAQTVLLQLIITPQQVQLLIEDDGLGFEAATIKGEHFGLIGINERTKLLGGQLRIESAPESGTRLEVTLPLEQTL
ncbi:MAG: GAF domain-containing sensor histidine kinase [Herpetosiphonaceae bacterium]|nr:GAF domain-containing sensor histidine kinase [Herpetosiphonaceae bacterium]